MKIAKLFEIPEPHEIKRDGIHEAGLGGHRLWIEFPNGFGASVIKTPFSYGGSKDLFELAVFHNGSLTYDTELTDDVLGYLKISDVNDYLKKISLLKSEKD